MIPAKAAKLVGCSTAHIRSLIRTGKIKAKKVPDPHLTNKVTGEIGFYYEISDFQVERLKQLPSRSTRGQRRKKSA